MENQLQLFKNEQFGEIKVVEIKNKPYAVANDILKALGYSEGSWRTTLSRKCKGVTKCNGLKVNGIEVNLIPEGDIYRLITGSHLEQAEKFESWVFDEVLPQIRTTGGYIPIDNQMSDAEIMARALQISQSTIANKDEIIKAKDIELEDKNKFINQIAISENSLLVREVAKIASKQGIIIGEKRLWQKLREFGLIFKNTTEPKQDGIDRGYFEVSEGSKIAKGKTFTYHTTRVTGKGQVYIIKKLLEEKVMEEVACTK